MTTNPLRLLVPLAVLSATAGCAELLAALRSSAIQTPTLTFHTAALSDISLAGLTLDTVWQLHNPYSVGLTLSSVEYALLVEGKRVVSGAPSGGLALGAAATSELHFPAAIRFADLVGVVEAFLNKDTAIYRVEGRLGFNTPIGVLVLPLSQDGTFEVPKVPQVAFGSPRVGAVGLGGATVEFPLLVTNRNTYALPISEVQGTLSIGGAPVGTLSTGNLGALTGKGTRTVSMPLNINLISAAGAVMTAVQGGNAQLGFHAQVQSGRIGVPLTVQQMVDFVR